MAINIQEILHPSDSNQIKWEKVNYNFDQILANGGGPTGQKGAEGVQGSVGQTGQKGQKGDIGPQGETGATTSRWKVIPINANGGNVNEYVILKPKISNDNYPPVIFLGDDEFDEVNGLDGRINLKSTLTLGKWATSGMINSPEYLTYWHGKRGNSTNDIHIVFSSSEQTDGDTDWTRFELSKGLGVVSSEAVEYFVNLDKFTFNSSVSFSDSADNIFRLPATSVVEQYLKGGELRYFGDTFWGAVKDSNGNVQWKTFCMSPCGQGGGDPVTIDITPSDDLIVNQYGYSAGNTVEIIPGGNLEVDDEGALWNGGVQGCTDPTAQNYDPNATVDDGSCIATIYGCTDPTALNYYAGADEDDGSCVYATTTLANRTITFASWPNTPVSYTGGSGTVAYQTGPIPGLTIINTSDVIVPSWVTVTSTFDDDTLDTELTFTVATNAAGLRTGTITIKHPEDNSVTDVISITQSANPSYGAGCTDSQADNYDPNATSDDGSCTYCANFTKTNMTETNPTTYGGSNGTFSMSATGGSANYQLTIFTNEGVPANPTALSAGTYTATIEDMSHGCQDTHTFTLTNPVTTPATTTSTTTATPTYTTTWTASESVSSATVHVTDSPGSAVDNTDTRIATAGTNVSRTFYMKPTSGYQFTSTSQVNVSVSQGSASVDSITSNGSIKINVTHTTNTSNNAVAVTITGGAVSSAPVYTAISANPSGTVNEGQQVTVSVTSDNIPNGTRVWVNMNLGQVTQSDVTSGWSSGAGSGDSPSNSSWGNWVTMNGNTGSHTITLKNDNSLEGTETLVFSLLSYDEANNATGSLQTSVDVLDTSYPATYTVTFINGNYNQYSTCQLTSNTKTAVYPAPSVGKATFTTVWNAISADPDYAGSAGVWFKIVSSTEPGFLHGDGTANHSAPITSQPCSGVTTTTTTTGSGTGSGCGVYYLGNTNYMYPVSLQGNYGCGGSYISINVTGASYQTSGNVFCSDQPQAVLNAAINNGLGNGFVTTGTGTGCAPGGSYPGAPS